MQAAVLENIQQVSTGGTPYWSALTIARELGCDAKKDWPKLRQAVRHVEAVCTAMGHPVQQHVIQKCGARKKIMDFHLSSLVCGVFSHALESGKMPTVESSVAHVEKVTAARGKQDVARVAERAAYSEAFKRASRVAKRRGVNCPDRKRMSELYRQFNRAGLHALYDMSLEALRKKRKLPEKARLQDFMGAAELKMGRTLLERVDEALRKYEFAGANEARECYRVEAVAFRAAWMSAGHKKPEDMPVMRENVASVRRRVSPAVKPKSDRLAPLPPYVAGFGNAFALT